MFLLISVSFTFAQSELVLKIEEKTFYDTEAISYVLEIPRAKYNDVDRAWAKYIKDSAKETVIFANGIYTIEKKHLPKISPDSIDLNSYVKDFNGVIVLTVSFKLNGEYVSDKSNQDIHIPAQAYVHKFGVEQYSIVLKNELSTENKKLDKLTKDLDALTKANNKVLDASKTFELEILLSADLLKNNEASQNEKLEQIKEQKETIHRLRNGFKDVQKAAAKRLKELESELKVLQDEKSALLSKNDASETQLRLQEREIAANEVNLDALRKQRSDQETICKDIESKMTSLK